MKDGFDGAVADQIREALRFLQPGAFYLATIDTHGIGIIRRENVGHARRDVFCVVCLDCKTLIALDCTLRAILVTINKHTEGNPVT